MTIKGGNLEAIEFIHDTEKVLRIDRGGWQLEVFTPKAETVKKWKIVAHDPKMEYAGKEMKVQVQDVLFDDLEEATNYQLGLERALGCKVTCDEVEVLK